MIRTQVTNLPQIFCVWILYYKVIYISMVDPDGLKRITSHEWVKLVNKEPPVRGKVLHN